MNCWIGIDSGMSGGMVAVTDDPRRPLYYFVSEKHTREDALEWLRRIQRNSETTVAFLEKIPYSIFGIKKSDMSKLYGSYSELRAFLIACGIPWSESECKVWIREFPITPRKKSETKNQWKVRHRDCARRVFKDRNHTISTDMSDAYLLAEYCRRARTGTLRGGKT